MGSSFFWRILIARGSSKSGRCGDLVVAAGFGDGAVAAGLLRELFGGVGGTGAGGGAGVCVAGECWLSGLVSVSAQGILFDMDGVLVSSIGSA